jgi:hypothetical protein
LFAFAWNEIPIPLSLGPLATHYTDLAIPDLPKIREENSNK